MIQKYLNLEGALESGRKEPTERTDDRAEHAHRQRMQQERIDRQGLVDFELKHKTI